MAKQFRFSKDDFLMGVLASIKEPYAKSELVKNIINEKIKRLNSEIKFRERSFQDKFGEHKELEDKWSSYTPKFKKDCNAAIDKQNKLIKQKREMMEIYKELQQTSFSNHNFKGLDKILERLFRWEKPMHYDDIYKRKG